MKKILFFCVLFFGVFTNQIFSQNTSYIISEGGACEAYKDFISREGQLYISPSPESIGIFDKQKTGGYFTKDGSILDIKGDIITLYDGKTLKVKKSIPVKNISSEQKSIGYIQFQGEYVMFFSSILKKSSKTIKYSFRKLDSETGSLGAEEQIFEVENARVNSRSNGFNYVHFVPSPEFKLSKDGSKLLFSFNQQFSVYETGMKLSWKTDKIYGELTPKGFYDFQDGMIDNDGTYYAILKVFKNEGQSNLKWHDFEAHREVISKANFKPNYDIWVLKINKSGVSRIKTEPLDGVFMHSLTLHRDSQSKLICAGMYLKDGSNASTTGFLSLELENAAATLNYYTFSGDIENLMKKKAKEGINDLHGLEIKNTADGHLLLIGEQNHGFDPSGTLSSSLGTYANMIVAKVNLKGDIIWIKQLPKNQIATVSSTDGQDLGCGSYKYLYLNGKHYIIYLDHKDNQALNFDGKNKVCTSCRDGYLFAYVLNDDGNLTKEAIFDLGKLSLDTQYDFKRDMKVISDTEFLFPILLEKGACGFVKITVK